MTSLSTKLIAGSVLLALSAAAGWGLRGVLADADIADIKLEAAQDRETATASTRALEGRLQRAVRAADSYYEELQHERRKSADFAGRLAGNGPGAIRVRVPARCAPPSAEHTGTAGLDHGAETAELDPAFAAAVARIVADGDATAIQLTALQAYTAELLAAFKEFVEQQKQEGADHGDQ